MAAVLPVEIELEIEVVRRQARLEPQEVEILRSIIEGIPREELIPDVPRDTVKTWVRNLLRKTRAATLQGLGLRVARDAFRHRNTNAGALESALTRVAREFADDVHLLLRQAAVVDVRRKLAGSPIGASSRRRRPR